MTARTFTGPHPITPYDPAAIGADKLTAEDIDRLLAAHLELLTELVTAPAGRERAERRDRVPQPTPIQAAPVRPLLAKRSA